MGFFRVLAQSALDFLIDERCHACGSLLPENTPAEPPAPLPPLAEPLDLVATAGFRLQTRLLCAACASQIETWSRPVMLAAACARPASHDAIPMHPAFVTDERLLTLIHLLKFNRRERIAPWLARAMVAVAPFGLSELRPGVAAQVVPVPMDRAAQAQRGFNQAETIARELAARWSLPMTRALVKLHRTRPQSALGREERLVNLEGAFHADPSVVGGSQVILVDDLVTTGATVHACARALRAAGAVEVRVVCAGYRDEAPATGARFSNLDNDFQSA